MKNEKNFNKNNRTGKGGYSAPRYNDNRELNEDSETGGVVSGRNAVSELLQTERALDKLYVSMIQ